MLFWPQAGWWAVRHKVTSILSGAERGTGLDHGNMSFHAAGRVIIERDWWRYPLCFSAFPYCCAGFRAAKKSGARLPAWQKDRDSFGGLEFHSVPNSSIHLYL